MDVKGTKTLRKEKKTAARPKPKIISLLLVFVTFAK